MDFIKNDPKEKDPEYKNIIEKARLEAIESLKDTWPETAFGSCHVIWNEQKRILKEKYNIDWKSPRELNPNARFD